MIKWMLLTVVLAAVPAVTIIVRRRKPRREVHRFGLLPAGAPYASPRGLGPR